MLRKELTISQNGNYEAAYNGKQSCYEKGKVSAPANAALWQEAQTLLSPIGQAKSAPAPHKSPRPRHTQSPRTAMDNGPPVETVLITNGMNSSIVLDPRLPAVRHFIDEVRQLLPPCAF